MPHDGSSEKRRLRNFYGGQFPGRELFGKSEATRKDGAAWREWVEARFREQRQSYRDRKLHYSRHRHFRQGRQWISSRDGRTWREPQKDNNTIRAVLNLTGPALDFRLGVLSEQRPGWRYEALGSSVNAREIAQAQQVLVEYYYHTQQMWHVNRDAFQAAQTDGVAFLHVYIDPEQGPTHQNVELVDESDERFVHLEAQGYRVNEDGLLEVPLDEQGEVLPPDADAAELRQGDIATRVVYGHEVIANPEAKTVNGPYDRARWMVIRRQRSLEDARIEINDPKLSADVSVDDADITNLPDTLSIRFNRGLPPFPQNFIQSDKAVFEYLVFLAPSPQFPNGAWVRLLKDRVVAWGDHLPGRVIPLAAVRDGSTDPALFPKPIMSDWIGDQVAINQLVSMLLQHVRIWGSGRLLAHKTTSLNETFTTVMGSLIEHDGPAPQPFPMPPASNDAWQLLQFLIQKLEDKSAWTDLSRGKVTGGGQSGFQDVSGRAVLAGRELFERQLGPMVRAAAHGMSDWADLVVRYARYLFDTPRLIPIVGGRSDLAKKISREMLGEITLVSTDPETLMPMPRALRNQMLFDMWQNGLITKQEYKSRAPFAFVRDAFSAEAQQWERAQRINEVLIERWPELFELREAGDVLQIYQPETGIPVLWPDDPTAHQLALLEIITEDTKPFPLRQLAMDRFDVYQDLAASKTPDPVTGQTAPVPLEVWGAPESLPRAGEAQMGTEVPTETPADGTPPGQLASVPVGGQTTAPAPAQQSGSAGQLGTFGSIEEQRAAGGEGPLPT